MSEGSVPNTEKKAAQEEGEAQHTSPEAQSAPEPSNTIKRPMDIVLEKRLVRRDNWRRSISNLSQAYINTTFQSLIPYYASAFADIKIIQSQSNSIPPIFSLYKPGSDTCYVGTAGREALWEKVGEKLNLFNVKDDLAIFTEIAYAHEIGHCIAFKYLTERNKNWSLYERELFSDAYAVLHIERWMGEDKDIAFDQLMKLRLGGPPDPERPSPENILQLKAALEKNEYEQISSDDFLYQAEQALLLLLELQVLKPAITTAPNPNTQTGVAGD